MDSKRHKFLERIWSLLYKIGRPFIEWKFNAKHDIISVNGPVIVISNHVSPWDPLLLALSFPKTKLYFVASEHIFRWGLLSRLITWLLEPLPRKKASMGTDTVMMCLRHLKAGHAVGLFAEGNASWDGLTGKIFPATGKLVRNSGASLITYRLEGVYLSAPRWGKGVRRGKTYGHMVGLYSAEQLRAMKPDEINDIINRDIYEDAWARQKTEQVSYSGKAPARYLERALFLCPHCKEIGGLKGDGRMLRCRCGFHVNYTALCTFDPPQPFENIAQWDRWQKQMVQEDAFVHDEICFRDSDMTLSQIHANHEEHFLYSGEIYAKRDQLCCGEKSFFLSQIDNMSLVQANILLFLFQENYYQLRADQPGCLRKYMMIWEREKQSA